MLHLGKLQTDTTVPLLVSSVLMNQQYHTSWKKKREIEFPHADQEIQGNQSLLLGFLVSLVREFKNRLKQQLEDNCISVYKKSLGQGKHKAQQLLMGRKWRRAGETASPFGLQEHRGQPHGGRKPVARRKGNSRGRMKTIGKWSFIFFSLSHTGLTLYFRLALELHHSSCLSLHGDGITGMSHHTYPSSFSFGNIF